jgi:hypothetical protein
LGDRGLSGVARDADEEWFWNTGNNKFDWNTYIVPNATTEYWEFNDRSKVWEGVRELGYEPNGEVIVESRTPTELSCNLQRS